MRDVFPPWIAAALIAFSCASACRSSLGCDPGNNVPCACPAGGYGRQVCASDGSGFGICHCDGTPAGSDFALSPVDMSSPAPSDSSTGPSDFSATVNDLATTTPMPDLTMLPLSGTVVLADLASTALQQPVRALTPLILFSAGAHDYNSMGTLGGCIADHYDVAKNKLPGPDADSGDVSFAFYAGGNFLDGQIAPSEIHCARVNGYYQCAYGNLINGAPGPSIAEQTFYPGMSAPIVKDSTIVLQGGGGANVNPWASKVVATDAMALQIDLSTVAYDPKLDFTLSFDCPTENGSKCGFTAVAIVIDASDQPPAMFGQASPTFGNATCFGVATNGQLKVEQQAISIALGCGLNAINCDPMLKSVRTRVMRISLPVTVQDAQGIKIATAAGRGLAGIAPR